MIVMQIEQEPSNALMNGKTTSGGSGILGRIGINQVLESSIV